MPELGALSGSATRAMGRGVGAMWAPGGAFPVGSCSPERRATLAGPSRALQLGRRGNPVDRLPCGELAVRGDLPNRWGPVVVAGGAT
jgi:hypothetical protein